MATLAIKKQNRVVFHPKAAKSCGTSPKNPAYWVDDQTSETVTVYNPRDYHPKTFTLDKATAHYIYTKYPDAFTDVLYEELQAFKEKNHHSIQDLHLQEAEQAGKELP